MKNIFVTGSKSFIGAVMCEKLSTRDQQYNLLLSNDMLFDADAVVHGCSAVDFDHTLKLINACKMYQINNFVFLQKHDCADSEKVASYLKESNINCVVLKLATVTGVYDNFPHGNDVLYNLLNGNLNEIDTQDYIHVYDVAGATHNALKRNNRENNGYELFEIGNGKAYTLQDIALYSKIDTDKIINRNYGYVASTQLTKQEMIWEPSYELDQIIETMYT